MEPQLAASSEESLIRASVRGFLESRRRPERLRFESPPGASFDDGIWQGLAELGLLGLRLPEDCGGSGLGPRCAAAVAEEAGRVLLPEPLISCALVPGAVVAGLAPSAGRNEVIGGLTDGAIRTVLCWQTRPGQLAPANGLRLSSNDLLSGDAAFVSHWGAARWLLVLAWRGDHPVLATVETSSATIARRTRRLGDGARSGFLTFANTPVEHVLSDGPAALTAVTDGLDEGALYAAAFLAGLGRGVLDRILEHLRTRTQFGRPLGTFQTLQHQAVDMHLALRLTEATVRRAARSLEMRRGPEATLSVSAAKARAASSATWVCRSAIQMFGGLGFAEEADLGVALRVAHQYASAFGARAAHLRRFGHLSACAA